MVEFEKFNDQIFIDSIDIERYYGIFIIGGVHDINKIIFDPNIYENENRVDSIQKTLVEVYEANDSRFCSSDIESIPDTANIFFTICKKKILDDSRKNKNYTKLLVSIDDNMFDYFPMILFNDLFEYICELYDYYFETNIHPIDKSTETEIRSIMDRFKEVYLKSDQYRVISDVIDRFDDLNLGNSFYHIKEELKHLNDFIKFYTTVDMDYSSRKYLSLIKSVFYKTVINVPSNQDNSNDDNISCIISYKQNSLEENRLGIPVLCGCCHKPTVPIFYNIFLKDSYLADSFAAMHPNKQIIKKLDDINGSGFNPFTNIIEKNGYDYGSIFVDYYSYKTLMYGHTLSNLVFSIIEFTYFLDVQKICILKEQQKIKPNSVVLVENVEELYDIAVAKRKIVYDINVKEELPIVLPHLINESLLTNNLDYKYISYINSQVRNELFENECMNVLKFLQKEISNNKSNKDLDLTKEDNFVIFNRKEFEHCVDQILEILVEAEFPFNILTSRDWIVEFREMKIIR